MECMSPIYARAFLITCIFVDRGKLYTTGVSQSEVTCIKF